MLPAVKTRCRFNIDAVEYRFYYGGYSVEVVFLDLGFLHQHIELCLGFMLIICKNYNGSSWQKSITASLPIRGNLPFNSSASLSARSDSFVFSCRICSTVWRSWLSSASCSASTKDKKTEKYTATYCKAHYVKKNTGFQLGYILQLLALPVELFGFTFEFSVFLAQLLGHIFKFLGYNCQLLGCLLQLVGRSR